MLITLGVGGTFALVEGTAVADGLWWAIVTVTTVGYGDIFPVTPAGRLAAAVLMVLGIGFVAYITAAVAAHFVGEEEQTLGDRSVVFMSGLTGSRHLSRASLKQCGKKRHRRTRSKDLSLIRTSTGS